MSADISTRYIYPGALHGQIADETPDQSLVFAARELAGIGLDSPLAAAGGDAANRVLNGHPEAKRLGGIHVHIGNDSNAVFDLPQGVAVMDPESLKNLQVPIIHANGNRKLKLALWLLQKTDNLRINLSDGSRLMQRV